MPLLNVPPLPRLSWTQAICCGLFLCGGAVFLAYEISGDPLEVAPVHNHSSPVEDELSRSGWAEEYAFHLCDAKKQGLNLEKAMTYAKNRSAQWRRAEAYSLELRREAYYRAAKRQCGA